MLYKYFPLITLILVLVLSGTASGQTKSGIQQVRYNNTLSFDGAILEARLMMVGTEREKMFDPTESGSVYYISRIGVLRIGYYYGPFGVYGTLVRLGVVSENDNYMKKYRLLEPLPIGVSFTPFFSSRIPKAKKERATVGSAPILKGGIGRYIRFFGEASVLAKAELLGDKDKELYPGINERFPPILTVGVQIGYGPVSLEAGYTYQKKDWLEFYKAGLISDSSGFNMTGPYICLNAWLGTTMVKAIPKTVTVIKRPKLPPALRFYLTFDDTDGNGMLDAEESGTIFGTLRNEGRGAAYKVQVELSASNSDVVIVQPKFSFLEIEPGASKDISFSFQAMDRLRDGEVRLSVTAKDVFDNRTSTSFNPRTLAYRPPRLEIVGVTTIDDDKTGDTHGNANSKIEPGEMIGAATKIRNTGTGVAYDVRISCLYDGTSVKPEGRTEFVLGDMQPSESRKIEYMFYVSPGYAGPDQLPISIRATESKGTYGFEQNPGLNLGNYNPPSTDDDMAGGPDPVDTPPVGKRKCPNGLAVVIGNFQYDHRDIGNVEFAQRDASIIREYLMATFGFSANNIYILENAAKSEFEKYFGTELRAEGLISNLVIPDQTELFIYYSGHGSPDTETGESYFLPSDADPGYIRLTGYSTETFYNNIDRLETAATTVVVDACFSGAYHEGNIIKDASPVYIDAPRSLHHGTIISSSQGDNVSSWYREKKHGAFTYFFLKGLSGEADRNDDREITIGEVEEYIRSEVPAYTLRAFGRTQLPVVSTEDREEVLVELK